MRNPFKQSSTHVQRLDTAVTYNVLDHIEVASMDVISKLTRLQERQYQLEEQIKRDQAELAAVKECISAYEAASTHLNTVQELQNVPWDAILQNATQRDQVNE